MSYADYSALQINVSDGVAWMTLDHPPINLIDPTLVRELKRFVTQIHDDDSVRVIVIQSNDPDFFSAHFDAHYNGNAKGYMELGSSNGETSLNPLQRLVYSVRSFPQVTITKRRGRATRRGQRAGNGCGHALRSRRPYVAVTRGDSLGVHPWRRGDTAQVSDASGRPRRVYSSCVGRATERPADGDQLSGKRARR